MKLSRCLLPLLCTSVLLSSCIFGKKEKSDKTGWNYNDPKYGGVELRKVKNQNTAPGLVFIPGGLFTMGQNGDDVGYEWNSSPRRVTVDSYFIDETEVTNQQYRDYLFWLNKVFVSYPNVYRNALPDTLVWRSPLAYNEPYVETYFRHPSFNNYPVIGVTWIQAYVYCDWRTDRVNELQLIGVDVLNPSMEQQQDADNFNTDAYLAGQYEGDVRKNLRDYSTDGGKGERRVNFEDGILFPKYRLPTEVEFEYAATALAGSTFDERVLERRMYPWTGSNVRNPAKKQRGRMMANFQRGRGDLMGVAGYSNDGYSTTSPVRSFPPNDFGLYDMAGNVNEWVADVYRPMSSLEVDEFRPFRGNVFTELAKDGEGNILEKDSLGRLRRDTIGIVERYNYQVGDNRNFGDGDIYSSVFYKDAVNKVPDTVANSNYMYFQGEGPSHKNMTTLISDKSRVYKGGSFLDRPYWLRPGTRRYLEEDRAQVDLGFRCAMNALGGEAKVKTKKKK
ncbi:MAG: SUMF1/EgtB/PvdO family nonheme iron enzyme [Prevotellaceae bacterium]|jgi:gliding motility-associated lipoprotein GldJ|nr:SUMF1/EgtB/PvdO family nonheme iron enzyme [Prevotellaceae bacterium]